MTFQRGIYLQDVEDYDQLPRERDLVFVERIYELGEGGRIHVDSAEYHLPEGRSVGLDALVHTGETPVWVIVWGAHVDAATNAATGHYVQAVIHRDTSYRIIDRAD
jgi:hypothetical protein